ncbi:MAG TPA: hypothetical protein PLU06_05340, partial [Candidatus Syntrophosphaera sp.]|nr:hypothetical protein [Candidatus Syntrophosphaera sp.]HQO68200.1 hypothetical protein [Candidatus Syntrophosphaera sp.]
CQEVITTTLCPLLRATVFNRGTMKRFILVVVCFLLPLANGFYDAQDSGDLAEDGPESQLRERIHARMNK